MSDTDILEKTLNEHARYKTALEEIAKGEGPFSMDQLTHAGNTIDAMKGLAIEALKEAKQ